MRRRALAEAQALVEQIQNWKDQSLSGCVKVIDGPDPPSEPPNPFAIAPRTKNSPAILDGGRKRHSLQAESRRNCRRHRAAGAVQLTDYPGAPPKNLYIAELLHQNVGNRVARQMTAFDENCAGAGLPQLLRCRDHVLGICNSSAGQPLGFGNIRRDQRAGHGKQEGLQRISTPFSSRSALPSLRRHHHTSTTSGIAACVPSMNPPLP